MEHAILKIGNRYFMEIKKGRVLTAWSPYAAKNMEVELAFCLKKVLYELFNKKNLEVKIYES